jgi:NTE family protein
MPTHDYPYKNLVFEGGGVKGVSYGGVFEVLEQRQITPQIESVAGTSAEARGAAGSIKSSTPVELLGWGPRPGVERSGTRGTDR